jgi:SAM-dependent methyltransferase
MTKTYSDAMELTSNYNRWVIKQFEPWLGKRIIEIGIGHGGSFAHLPQNCKYLGVDIDPTVVLLNKKKYPRNKYIVSDVTKEEFVSIAKEFKADTVICFNVLEHIKKDNDALKLILKGLPRGGCLHILVPSHKFLFNEIDKLAGHYRRYSKKELENKILSNFITKEIDIMKFCFFNPVGAIGWLINKYSRHSSIDSNALNFQISVFDKYFIWPSKILQPFTKFFFGQSLILVIKKKSN